jgi:hypothetical protein
MHRHQRALHAAERRHRHPGDTTNTANLSQPKTKCLSRERRAPGYLEIPSRRREARGREAADSSGERATDWRESAPERVGGEPERSAPSARRALPAAAAAIYGAVCRLKPFSGSLQIWVEAEGLGGPGLQHRLWTSLPV